MSQNHLWMYIKEGKPTGPITEEELFSFIESKKLSLHDLVAQKGDRSWVSIKEHPQLAERVNASSTQPLDDQDVHWVLLVKKPPHRGGGYTQKGPFSKNQLMDMVKVGDAAFTDFAWRPGYSQWTKIADTEMFSSGKATEAHEPQDEELPDIPQKNLLDNVVVQSKKQQQQGFDDKDLVRDYESRKVMTSTPPLPETEKKQAEELPPSVPEVSADSVEEAVSDKEGVVSNEVAHEEDIVSDEVKDSPAIEEQLDEPENADEEFNEAQAPIINTTTQAFKDLEQTSANAKKPEASTKTKKRRKRKKTLLEKILGPSKKKKPKKKSTQANLDDFKSWRDEEAFLKAARREQIKKTVIQFSLMGGFGISLFALSFFLIIKYMAPKTQSASTPTSRPPEPKASAVQPKALEKKFASYLKLRLRENQIVFEYDTFKSPMMNLVITSNPKRSLLPGGFYFQNLLQVSGKRYSFPIDKLVAGEYFVKAQLDEQQMEEKFQVKAQEFTESRAEWAKKRRSLHANKEKFFAIESSRALLDMASSLKQASLSDKSTRKKFFPKWNDKMKRLVPSFVTKGLSKINGPSDLIYINFWLEFQSKQQTLEQLAQMMNNENNVSASNIDLPRYQSLYETARVLSQW